jgi:Predicted endonuclease distantly related to archaeal Holliday junction resolvase
MSRHLRLGEAGERLAEEYLARRGLRIVDRRVRFARGEIDLVGREGDAWVFVEVKTRSGTRMGKAAEAMTPTKLARMRRAVEEYVRTRGLEGKPVRCDLFTVDFDGDDVPTLGHFPGAIIF